MLEIKEDTSKKKFYRSIEKVKKQLEKRNIKSLIGIPLLLTAISQVELSPAYAAPLTLTTLSVSTLLTTTGILTGLKAFLATKAGIAAIIGTTAIAGTGLAVETYQVTKTPEKTADISEVKQSPIPYSVHNIGTNIY